MNESAVINEIINLLHHILSFKLDDIGFKKIKYYLDSYYNNKAVSDAVLSNVFIKKEIDNIRQKIQDYESEFEKQLVRNMNSFDPAETYLHSDKLTALHKEAEMLGLSGEKKMVILGSGPYPVTAIYYAKYYKTRCKCIDIDEEAVELSTRIINGLHLADTISIENADALSYPLKGYDIIFVTACCVPKKKIFNRIRSETDGLVCFRRPNGLYNLWYTDTGEDIYDGYSVINEFNDDNYPLKLLLTRRK